MSLGASVAPPGHIGTFPTAAVIWEVLEFVFACACTSWKRLQAVAALAGVSLALKRPGAYSNATKAATYLAHAKQLFEFAKTVTGGT